MNPGSTLHKIKGKLPCVAGKVMMFKPPFKGRKQEAPSFGEASGEDSCAAEVTCRSRWQIFGTESLVLAPGFAWLQRCAGGSLGPMRISCPNLWNRGQPLSFFPAFLFGFLEWLQKAKKDLQAQCM